MKSLVACDQFQILQSDCYRHIQSCGQILLIKKTSAQLLWLKAPTVRTRVCVELCVCAKRALLNETRERERHWKTCFAS